MYYFAVCILVFFAIVGFCVMCMRISGGLWRGVGDGILVLEPMSGHCEDAEFILRSAARKTQLSGFGSRIICVDAGMDRETRRVCELVCREYRFMKICRKSELTAMINEL